MPKAEGDESSTAALSFDATDLRSSLKCFEIKEIELYFEF